jgi:murein hydrolase activator
MRRFALMFLLCPLLSASALAQSGDPLDGALNAALAEQASADAQTARLEQAAAKAQTEAGRLHALQAAAAQAIEAAEARISAANLRLQLASAYVAAHRQQLATEQQPVSSLLAGLATMGRRPPLLVLADRGGTDELVKVRLLLDATLPVIRSRTSRLSAELSQGRRLQQAALAARTELARSRDNLAARQRSYAELEQKAVSRALASEGQALGTGDVAMAAGEDVERLRGEVANSQSIRTVAAHLASGEEAAPLSPFAPEGGSPLPAFAYQLPAASAVSDGLASVNASGVRSRGLTLATSRGAAVTVPADGVVKFAGRHAGGWMTLIVNVATELHVGDRVRLGDSAGRALGPLQVELSRNGRRISPALIAGSSQTMSKAPKGG